MSIVFDGGGRLRLIGVTNSLFLAAEYTWPSPMYWSKLNVSPTTPLPVQAMTV